MRIVRFNNIVYFIWKAFELDKKYGYIRGRLNMNKESGSIIRWILPLSKELGISVKEAKYWIINSDGKGWFPIESPEKAIKLYDVFGKQIEYEARTIEDSDEVTPIKCKRI